MKELSAELRQQRANNRQLKSELNDMQKNTTGFAKERNNQSDESHVVRIKIRKEKRITCKSKLSRGINKNYNYGTF